MYGVPNDLPLAKLQGATLVQIAVGTHQLQFNFSDPAERILLTGGWEFKDINGNLLDASDEASYASREQLRFFILLGQKVVKHWIDSPKSFSLQFESGHSLTFVDDSEQYESIEFAGRII